MVSSETLEPLVASSVEFTYCLDRPLRCIATRYTNAQASDPDTSAGICLIFACGISLAQETWIPVIKEFFRLSSVSSNLYVRSAWVIERPNHGDSALLNSRLLQEHYTVQFTSFQYATAIYTFLTSDFLSPSERDNLVAIGHSGGGGSLMRVLDFGLRDERPILFKSLVLLEVPLVGPMAYPLFLQLYDIVKKSNARRTTSWPSKSVAMNWFRSHLPWNTFDPEVLKIIEETYFTPDLRRPGYITTKTTVEQETATFVDSAYQLGAAPFLQTILDVMPTHVMMGSINDLLLPPLRDMVVENIQRLRPRLASVTFLDGVGHYIPTATPHYVAKEIFEKLQGQQINVCKL
ncbi:Alpha/beta-hydrolase [Favolaschia claudopus]|uniref:Alpha/beta-hydrolase n=1 Tax=Favolaschia claudopus TaxID=2862362 RepID=A0AAW0EI86_9AGAR